MASTIASIIYDAIFFSSTPNLQANSPLHRWELYPRSPLWRGGIFRKKNDRVVLCSAAFITAYLCFESPQQVRGDKIYLHHIDASNDKKTKVLITVGYATNITISIMFSKRIYNIFYCLSPPFCGCFHTATIQNIRGF